VLSAARKALELDPELVEARVLLADALQKDWQWAEAEAEYKQAIALSPSDAGAHASFSYWFLCQGGLRRRFLGRDVRRSLTRWRFTASKSAGYSFMLAATTRPFENCALC